MTHALRGVLALSLSFLIAAAPAAAQMTLLLGAGPGSPGASVSPCVASPPTFVEANGGQGVSGSGSFTLGSGGVAGDLLLFQNDQGFTGSETIKRHTDAVSLANFASGPTFDIHIPATTLESLWYSTLIAAETSVDVTNGPGASQPFSQAVFRPGSGQTFDTPVIHPSGSAGQPAYNDGTSGGGTQLTLDGFTPGAKSCGAVIVIVDRAHSASITQHSGTTGWTEAVSGGWASQFGTYGATVFYNFAYAGGNPVFDFSSSGSGLFHYGYLIELKYN